VTVSTAFVGSRSHPKLANLDTVLRVAPTRSARCSRFVDGKSDIGSMLTYYYLLPAHPVLPTTLSQDSIVVRW
jgi:hypothetical protein